MNKSIRTEEKIGRKHTMLWPVIFIIVGAIVLGAIVVFMASVASKSINIQNRYKPLQYQDNSTN